MILDLQTRFSDAQAVTATAISENVADLRVAATPTVVDHGLGEDLWLIVMVGTAATSGGSATLTITLESDSTADLATSATVHYSSGSIALAALTANALLVRTKLPSGNYERYLGLRYTVGTADLTAGTFNAFLTPNVDRSLNFPSGYSI